MREYTCLVRRVTLFPELPWDEIGVRVNSQSVLKYWRNRLRLIQLWHVKKTELELTLPQTSTFPLKMMCYGSRYFEIKMVFELTKKEIKRQLMPRKQQTKLALISVFWKGCWLVESNDLTRLVLLSPALCNVLISISC